ncbi:peptidoglycan glycosyltransferase /cell elongation-specific peptidoglycan D,D-transpeptidase [Sulfuritortus calidifontis]|uniref:Peptidoglycan D,D-transpeptidase MrdA n=1 Tax=Sulfuritortus calidifontis TaxID=1914471 RepID=A0A4R3JVK9_9PROT|nr:penicillin-binding protein 2 [Sulfuritortus calidifontis]TCS72113.1 peptidoglycan glycosyltransferase /cell elongation-specific peptidoglycan D,D-transpeptidase [Sulfuritortus calidifontis]
MATSLRMVNPDEELRRYNFRIKVASGIVVAAFSVLFSRFVWLQLVEYDRYHALAENNRISLMPNAPARGIIYDRNGTVLAHNFAAYTLEITPAKAGKLEDTINRLSEIVSIDAGDRKRFKKLMAESKNFETLPIKLRLTEAEVARFAVNSFRFPGVEVKARLFRQYPMGDAFAHVIGYIGRINQRDEDRLQASGQAANYRGSDHIGKAGVEESYETLLHGVTGIAQVETDSGGRAVRVLAQTPPVAGNNVYLHLDAKLQEIATNVFGPYRGALVALDPRNGGVLALVSKPGYDPNLFVDGIDVTNWRALNDSPDKPLVNRALRGIYPPGSTIKPFMALAGLELGYRKPGDVISDPGYYSLPGSSHRYRDWKKDGHGVVDLKKSVVISCDTYYYRLANEMGIEKMSGFLSQLGFGHKTGIDLDGELTGLMPTPEWKQKRFKQQWWAGETVIAGIGQGYTLATPLQLAVATMAVANNGTVYQPQLLRGWRDTMTGRITQNPPKIAAQLKLDPEHLRLVKEAMVDVTRPGGTAAGAGAGAEYLFAGKTGTAQVIGIKQGERYNESKVAARHRDHALFISFAPADDPKIVVAVMVENGGHGGSTAAPIARKVIDYWLLGKIPEALKEDAAAESGENEDVPPPAEQATQALRTTPAARTTR